ncbi:MAG: hypothetical protein IT440_01655 [Phycisphaeraceae bacterium]|nr:hypothetical protein [Phycisphaeraceae bacterium]
MTRVLMALMLMTGMAMTIVGCDQEEPAAPAASAAKPAVAPVPVPAMPTPTPAPVPAPAADEVKKAADATATDAAKAAKSAADAAASKASAALDTAKTAANDVVTKASSLLDQFGTQVKNNKLDIAADLLKQLESLKAQLPKEWQDKIEAAKTLLAAKKAAASFIK